MATVRYIVHDVDAAIAFYSLEVDDLEGLVEGLRGAGVSFRNEIVTGVGGKQILVDDPSGNPIELFEPILPEAREEATREA